MILALIVGMEGVSRLDFSYVSILTYSEIYCYKVLPEYKIYNSVIVNINNKSNFQNASICRYQCNNLLHNMSNKNSFIVSQVLNCVCGEKTGHGTQ